MKAAIFFILSTILLRAPLVLAEPIDSTKSQPEQWQKFHASLGIFNMYGQRVATLVEGWKVAGLYQVRWNAANAPSGIYFYRLQAAGLVETRRMFLIK